MDKVYKFQILLPNETTVHLEFQNPEPRMAFQDFIRRVKDEYDVNWRRSGSQKRKRDINWKACSFYLLDAADRRIKDAVNFNNFKPHECHILSLQDDDLQNRATTFQDMWDLTPDTDILKELPEEYTFETALADLIDNSLQAVWSNEKHVKYISVDVSDDSISIFDTGPGMDGTGENCIEKWGKMGASLHRKFKREAIGGTPPYLKPYFGMFGYGGPLASMKLGRCAIVSSKTKESKKVYTLNLDRDAILKGSSWKTVGGMREPQEAEISRTSSFTKVEIAEPRSKLDIYQLQCKLKDVYFPYIQYDEESKSGKTIMPVQFEVNGTDLAEIQGGETAITNLHSCNGPNFVLQLKLSHKKDGMHKLSDSKANARLKCVYFPVSKGKENIERIMEGLESEGCRTAESFESFGRVSIRRLGRLLPDARWAWLPFMDLKQKRGDTADMLKRCCMRVKCFIDTDAGFNPNPSKTDLAQHSRFTAALKNLGNKILEAEKDVKVQIYRNGKLLNPLQLKKDYEAWILKMHEQYDDAADCGQDQPEYLVNPANQKALHMSSNVARLHKSITRNGQTWWRGQNIKLLKGACTGIHKNNVYATIEYFLLDGFQGDSGGASQILCRPSSVPDGKGCILSVDNGYTKLDLGESLPITLSVIDTRKCVPVEENEWNIHIERQRQKYPSTIDLLGAKQCQELDVDGDLPVDAQAGKVPPEVIVAVVRPGNYVSSSASNTLDHKYIVKSNLQMSMEVNFRGDADGLQDVEQIFSMPVGPTSHKGIQGLYVFPLKCQHPDLFHRAGVYTFSFYLNESDCKSAKRRIQIKPSSKVGKWGLLTDDLSPLYEVRVGSVFPPLSIACYDIYDNQVPFETTLEVVVKVQEDGVVLFHVEKFQKELSTCNKSLIIKDILIESIELDKIRPRYEATLFISGQNGLFSVSIPCRVNPGPLQNVKALPPTLESPVLPGCTIEEFILEMFDKYGNHVKEGTEVELTTDGFSIQDQLGTARKADHHGCINLGGLLKVTAGYGKNVSLSVYSHNDVLFKLEAQTEKRELRISGKVPEICMAGTHLENLVFEIVNSIGVIDDAIHHEEKCGKLHMLSINAGSYMEESLRYTFKHGLCTVPAISVPDVEGSFDFVAAHSSYPELHLKVKVPVMQAPKEKYNHLIETERYDATQSPCKVFPLQDMLQPAGNSLVPNLEYDEYQSPCPSGNLVLQLEKFKEQTTNITQLSLCIQDLQGQIVRVNEEKATVKQQISDLQGSVEPYISNHCSTKEELICHIESMRHTAAAMICNRLRKDPFQDTNNHLMSNVIGLVALLGTVGNNRLSRILAEYLGKDQMLAVVCRFFEDARRLRKELENSIGRSFVICLEELRAYSGGFDGSDPQRKLALPNPVLPSGTTPDGFLGYAVNMIDLDILYLHTKTPAGHGLRETLFYCLFGELQVYETREDMLAASACITHGAVSLDGEILKQRGVISFGFCEPEICFPVSDSLPPLTVPNIEEVVKELEENKSYMRKLDICLEKTMKRHSKSLKKFKKKKKLADELLDEIHCTTGGIIEEQPPEAAISLKSHGLFH